jgi:DNA-binding transcriptional MerR regulator
MIEIAKHAHAGQQGREVPSHSVGSGLDYQRVFASADVARLAGITLRQLQWWDERELISPRQEDHRRVYVPEEVLEVLTVANLRRKGLSLQKVRRVLRLLRSQAGQLFAEALRSQSDRYVLTDGHSAFVEEHPERVAKRLLDATRPMYVLSLSEQIKRLGSAKR